jgi:hypothetical protein
MMGTAWIQIFILTFSECVAPSGKTVCQEQQFELQFLSKKDCEYALQQFIAAKEQLDYVIVDRQKSVCTPSAAQSESYASLADLEAQHRDTEGWRAPGENESRRTAISEKHSERLANLMPCEETNYVVPCRVGDIIVEDVTGDSVEIWKRD